MKTRIFINALAIIGLLCTQSFLAQDPTFEWVKQIGGTNREFGNSIAVDAFGNIFTAGNFKGTVDFDPGEGIINLESEGHSDFFIQKLDSNGAFVWVKQMRGISDVFCRALVLDASGNIYSTGVFEGTIDFDPGVESANLTSEGLYDTFIQKLNANGNFIWAKKIGGTSFDVGSSIAVDDFGNVYTSGNFKETVVFDPENESTILVSAGNYDVFVQKLDVNGDLLWAARAGGPADDYCYDIDIDLDGNVYATGRFKEEVDFDPGEDEFNLESFGYTDVFIQKLSTNGNFLWAKQMGGNLSDNSISIAVDYLGNVVTTGFFRETADFNPGEEVYDFTSDGETDIFVQKIDANGDFIWARQMGGQNSDLGRSIFVDGLGNIYTVGSFQNIVDFDPGVGMIELNSQGGNDIYIQKLDLNGDCIWAKQMGGASEEVAVSIFVDESGNIYTTGNFQGTGDFNPGEGISNLTSIGEEDVFIQKLSQSTPVSLSEIDFDVNLFVYPNPSSDMFNIEFENVLDEAELTITDIHGRLVLTRKIRNVTKSVVEINEAPGIYLLTIKTKAGQKTIQLVKE